MMQSLSTLLSVDRAGRQPVYLQIANQLTGLIREGVLQAGHRLPGSRQLAEWLSVHRKTVVQAYDELLAQGWLESRTGSGTFVARHLPEIQPQKLSDGQGTAPNPALTAGFGVPEAPHLDRPVTLSRAIYHLDDGFPDSRLAPLEDLSRAYRSQLLHGNPYLRLGYGDTLGALRLRQALAGYLNDTRGLHCTPENILITRGTIMGMYLVCTGLLQRGDKVVTASLNWAGCHMNFVQAGARILSVPVDQHGMVVEALESICRQQTIRLVYVTSHHHYPTTVVLRADRRLQLLRLAEKYRFIIFEDDYDYDFHYQSKPLLPLASADRAGMVLYCGSFTKAISPAFRVGYIVGSENVIRHLARLRRIIDRQGDNMLENSIADLLQQGIIQRSLRKAVRAYRQRRDFFCDLLKDRIGDSVSFRIPDGGLAVWTQFAPQIEVDRLAQKAAQQDLYFYRGLWSAADRSSENAVRMGFASSTPEELEKCVEILERLVKGA